MPTLYLATEEPADRLLSTDPLALLIGMLLDQQVPMEWAFGAPYRLAERLGADRLDAAQIAGYDPDELATLFSTWRQRHRRWVRRTFEAALRSVEGPARRRRLGLLVVGQWAAGYAVAALYWPAHWLHLVRSVDEVFYWIRFWMAVLAGIGALAVARAEGRASPDASDLQAAQALAAFVHAVAHIEFNAIDLAWDAVYRFRGLPAGLHALQVTWPGYRPASRDTVLVRSGEIVRVDVRLALTNGDGRWELAVYGRNITDEDIKIGGPADFQSKSLDLVYDAGGTALQRGARYGVQLLYCFGS